MGSQVLSPNSLEVIRAISAVESMKVGTYHFTPDSKYDMDAYMPTVGSEAWNLC